MRVTSGLYKFKKIATLSNLELRPTASKTRLALFNILMNRYNWNKWCHKSKMLDAFSGSGIISIEAFSRKLHNSTLIEENKSIFENLEDTITKVQLTKKVELINKSFFDVILKKKAYDIVYLDPPYGLGYTTEAIKKILKEDALKKNALLICEAEKKYQYDINLKSHIVHKKNYGKTSLTFFNFF